MVNLIDKLRIRLGRTNRCNLTEAYDFMKRNGVSLLDLGLPYTDINQIGYAEYFTTFHDLRAEVIGKNIRIRGVYQYSPMQDEDQFLRQGSSGSFLEEIDHLVK